MTEGGTGELALSNLFREDEFLLRYATKDFVWFSDRKYDCGRIFLRMADGVPGRTDDMFIFGGRTISLVTVENFSYTSVFE
ncbi:MAG: hypothetical protein LBQ00_08505 [Syntrophobacterales bacterium]|nr:hypothetical protein [Syntrophobacterales bacterium]